MAPGSAVIPTPMVTLPIARLDSAAETVDGLGIVVSTVAGKQGSADAPTAAQVLAHITSFGTTPSDWTTNMIIK